ncbi:MAG: UbiD family decarboxylase [Thermoanaerobaculia bacterium]|nr:MAG: UbiD family decarboxylase [Thermoanaerobaculia bacterium]MBZ0103198.1 nucleotidyltransferase [Thermoanaerobaculia bacterium]
MDPVTRLTRLQALPDERDPARRRMLALGLVADRLAEDGLEPILVGGAALEFYTAGGYATGDVDLALESSPRVDQAFADLGFRKSGRFWVREDLDLLFEAPAPPGLPGETSPRTVVEIDGLRVVVIGIEDLLIDRLRAAVHWKSDEDRRWARRLVHLYSDRLDWVYLRERTAAIPEESTALEALAGEVGG